MQLTLFIFFDLNTLLKKLEIKKRHQNILNILQQLYL